MSYEYDANGNLIQPGQGAQQVAQTPPAGPGYGPAQSYQPAVNQQVSTHIDPNSLPEHLRNRQRGEVENDLDAGAGISCPKLSIKGKQFRFIEGDQERPHPFGQPLHVIILTTDPKKGPAKSFYGKSYVEGEDQAPICYSSDGHTPDSGSSDVQAPSCAQCPHNRFGTARQQDGTMGRGKACRDFKRVYVVPYDQPFSGVYELKVPPTSFQPMQAYGNELTRLGVRIYEAVTTLNFTAETSPVLSFSNAGFLPQEVAAKLAERISSGEFESLMPSLNKTPAEYNGAVTGTPAVGHDAPPALGHDPQTGAPVSQTPPAGATPPPPPGATPPPPPAQQPAPCPLGAPAGFRMTAKGGGATYQAFISGQWSDKALIDNGYMEHV